MMQMHSSHLSVLLKLCGLGSHRMYDTSLAVAFSDICQLQLLSAVNIYTVVYKNEVVYFELYRTLSDVNNFYVHIILCPGKKA